AVLVLAPPGGAVVVPVKASILCCPKFARLRIINALPPDFQIHPSGQPILLNSEVSKSIRFGPKNWLRPAFPYVPAIGSRKALGLNQRLGSPVITGPLNAGFRLGTSGLAVSPEPERFEPTVGVKGNPDCAVKMPFHCHPLMSWSTSPLAEPPMALPLPNGNS